MTKELGNDAAYHPKMGDKEISLAAAENSLVAKLEHVRELKSKAYAPKSPENTNKPKSEVVDLDPVAKSSDMTMGTTGPRKTRRPDLVAEDLEEKTTKEEESWAVVEDSKA